MASDPVAYIVDSNGTLATIDLMTGITTVIGNTGVNLTSIAFSPTGQLFGATSTSLYSVSAATGAATKIGDFDAPGIIGIRFSGSGTLYADAESTLPSHLEVSTILYAVSPQNAKTSMIGYGTPGGSPTVFPSPGQLTFSGGSLYEPELDRIGTALPHTNPAFYRSINTTTGTFLSYSTNASNFFYATFAGPNSALYGISSNSIDSINPSTGSATQVLTFNNASLGSIVSAASPTEAAAQGNFFVQDGTNGQYSYADGTAYAGPVPGLTSQFVTNTSDILNVTALAPNAFIEVGYIPGQQTAPTEGGINVSLMNGNNVLDGYAGSNFLTGGTGSDTFYVDDRTLTQNSWSTVVNFHAGDGVTMWGVTPQDFTTTVLDGHGAAGYTGATIIFSAAGKPAAAVTLAGYTSADLINGRLDVSYGATPATGGLAGVNYMHIQGG